MIHFSVNFYIQFFGTGDNCKIELILFNRVLRNDMDSMIEQDTIKISLPT